MSLRRRLGTAVWLVLLLLVLSLLVGHALGQPIFLGFVTSGSMEPAIGTGDGFVAVPQPLAGEPEAGDVVVFEARELHDGGLVTHRVVEVREDGYVTKGDANPFTDQDGAEPLVRDQQIVAEAMQVRGSVLTIPHLGTAAMAVSDGQSSIREGLAALPGGGALGERGGFGGLLIVAGLSLITLALRSDARTLQRTRERANHVPIWAPTAAVALLVVAFASAAMILPAGVHEVGVAAEPGADGTDPLEVEPGSVATLEYELQNAAPMPVVVVQAPRDDGVAVADSRLTLAGSGTHATSVTVDVPDEAGVHYRSVEQFYYFAVLPPSVLERLHAVHPLLALLAVDLVIGVAVVGLLFALFGRGDLRLRSRSRPLPPTERLRRLVGR